MTCTIYKNIYPNDPNYIAVDSALTRIAVGRSKSLVEEIRRTIDKEKASNLKNNLPAVCFSGKFLRERTDGSIQEHSGFIVLDFDKLEDVRGKQTEIINNEYVYACWVSPSGNGLKALVKIAKGEKHREHFQALQEIFPEVDKSGINPSRVCYESYDPEIYINQKSKVFAKTKTVEKILVKEANADEAKTFSNLLTWLSNKRDAFVTGERNNFIFKLASACCRFGIAEDSAISSIEAEFLNNSDFSKVEAVRTIKSAYRANRGQYGNAVFEKESLVDKVTRKEIRIEDIQADDDPRTKDVIYGIDVKGEALEIYRNGFAKVNGIEVPEFDTLFKMKRGEITLLSGYGNQGKSSLYKWYMVMRILLYGEKFATFSPEDNPPGEYYHDLVEILLGCDCTPFNPSRPNEQVYDKAYDFISKHVFYVYPKDIAPTPDYIKERFLELIVKEKIDGVSIDPFNQMSNEYSKSGRTDKYLETFLSDCSRFAQINNVYFLIIAHPTKAVKDATGNYPCPDVFDIADGAMWNNKMDNILIYHRPYFQTDPSNPTCEFNSKKIRRQKTVGKRGFILFEMIFRTRRFFFNGSDPMQKIINKRGLDFQYKQQPIFNDDRPGTWRRIEDVGF